VLEGRLIWLAPEALRLGTSVILDFGFWARDERSALRWLALYLPVDRATSVPGSRIASPGARVARDVRDQPGGSRHPAGSVRGPGYGGTGRN
jgi:hypothetical protein